MIRSLQAKNIAFIGGGNFCKSFLQLLGDEIFNDLQVTILGVADIKDDAEGLTYACQQGLYVCHNFQDLYKLDNLDLLIEVTRDDDLPRQVQKELPATVQLLDHFQAVPLWNALQIETVKRPIKDQLARTNNNPDQIQALFMQFSDSLEKIIYQSFKHTLNLEKDLVEHEKTISQIIEGSTIPTFVINKDHIVTHWNRACEKLTGYAAEKIVGTNHQWKPFRAQKRPIMADLILEGTSEEDVLKYYGTRWRKSALIEGAFEAEEYFAHLGSNGKFLFFTAAPIKAPDGTLVGAIETLWDKTEEKLAERERDKRNRELKLKAQQLADNERIMAQIIQGSTIPTFVINKDHVVTHWNRACEKLTGHSAAEIVGTNRQWSPFYENERSTMADVIVDQPGEAGIRELYGVNWRKSTLIEGAYESEGFFPGLGKEGKWCWFTAAPIKDPDGHTTGAIETLWDRTEQKKAEEEKERHYTDIAGLCSIYTALNTSLDLDQRIEAAAQEMHNLLGTDGICLFLKKTNGHFELQYNDDITEQSCKIITAFHQDDIIDQVVQSGKVTIFENLLTDRTIQNGLRETKGIKSLAYIPISTEAKNVIGVLRLASKEPNHFSTEGQDILDLIGNRIGESIENSLLHEKFIRSEEKYRSLFNNDPNPIFIIDRLTLRILDVNRRAESSYGFARQELLGKPFVDMGDANDEELLAGLKGLSNDQSILFSKKRHFNKEGLPLYVNVNVCYAQYRENDVLIATTTDITETVEKETQLIQAGKMTTLGQMAAGIAHEINQPLNVIQVCADYFLKMIQKGEPIANAELKTLAQDISGNVQRAAGIIKHMRDFSRQSEGVRNRVNINDPIKDIFKVMQHQIEIHNVEIELALAPDMPDILAEHNRLEQVFINLVTNAIDAMDEKCRQPEWKASTKRLTLKSYCAGDRVVVEVKDTGLGMSQEVMDKFFEPFFTTKEVGKGTGLGVSISYGIVKDYDGTIDVTSQIGEGTTFTLTFPALDL